jgi:hypothetical protein
MCPSKKQDRERLEQELETDEYQRLLRDLHRRNPFLRQFMTWADVIVFMREGTSQDPRKDEILRPIFEAHATDKDPRWRAVLLTIFWPGLQSIHFRKRRWDPDPEELWHNLAWIFLEVLCRIDVRSRPKRLVQKVVNDTAHLLHDEYRRIWNRATREKAADPEEMEELSGFVDEIDTIYMELREIQELEIRRLRGHLEAGRITEADYLLLVGTRVYGKPVVDYAREMGLAYQAVKKRRLRAEAVIRRFHEEIDKLREPMSPSSSERGLYPARRDRIGPKEVRKR